MNELERKRLEVEMAKVQAVIIEMEFKIMEREDDIKRVKQNIEISYNRIQEIKTKLQGSD